MALIDRLSKDFPDIARAKGLNYFQRGVVDLTRQTHRSLAASVQGDRRYAVEIDWDGGFLEYDCDCEEFKAGGPPCLHVWATLLEAQRKNRLPKTEEDDDSQVESERAPQVWKTRLSQLKRQMSQRQDDESIPWPSERELVYVIDVSATIEGSGLIVEIASRGKRRDGEWEKLKPVRSFLQSQLSSLPEIIDRQIVQMLTGTRVADFEWGYVPPPPSTEPREIPRQFMVPPGAYDTLLRMMCQSSRCRLRLTSQDTDPLPLEWDDGPPWQFIVGLKSDSGGSCRVDGYLRRGEERMELSEAQLLVPGGLVFARGKVSVLDDGGAYDLIDFLRTDQKIAARAGQERKLLEELFSLPRLPRLELPQEMGIEQVRPVPRPCLRVRPPGEQQYSSPDSLRAELSFDYDGHPVPANQDGAVFFLPEKNKLVQRDTPREWAASGKLRELGFKPNVDWRSKESSLLISPKSLPGAVRVLASEGWKIEAEGKLYRNPGKISIDVRSGIDWFEVHAVADFDGKLVALPRLLASLRRGENTVTLDDGTVGILPEEWLKKYGLLAGMGDQFDEHLRFKKSQAGLLDALLATREETTFDAGFSTARKALAEFEGVREIEPPAGFVGELRPYQKEGLGWMSFLRRFSFGGCLADDMGLGKTVQVLAMLEERRQQKCGPSLVVVPRSLVFNWKAEALKFAPQLKIMEHTGPLRDRNPERFVRNDALFMQEFQFDHVVLDEAQAVKNSSSESAKAVRLLNGKHRLALSGTPVQNHLGELWSLFEFLNPGMLGASSALSGASAARTIDPEAAGALSRALRPFILRRTKDQVARELPERTEQTLFCELDPAQRKMYDELRDHYRQALWTRIEQDGLAKSKIMVLEALLRLRQAACHPGLIDKERVGEPSAKLDALMASLEDVHEEGHKALVFSQFTSFLSIVKQRLDADKIPYEYLDGKTRDREERVKRFQTDPNCKLFLVSLKAGGLGLNLTAAEYVFLLDPWWNPAVEAQAIDRAHRIGQTRRVFAYRLITRDTVEQKVLELQKTKRDLADAIITEDNRTLATLRREDLEMLLS
jgi:superfamily II DNA or RNA helicase